MRFGAPRGLVPWLRWLGLFLGSAAVAATLPVLTLTPPALRQGAVPIAAALVLPAAWVTAYRTGRYPRWADALAPVAVLVVALHLASPLRALPVALAAVVYRAVWGRRPRALGSAAAFAAAFALSALGRVVLDARPWPLAETLIGTMVLVLAALVTHEVVGHLAVHDRAARHREVLTGAASELLGAGDPATIAAVLQDRLCTVLGPTAAHAVTLWRDNALVVAAAHDPSGVLAVEQRFYLQALAPGVRERLSRGEPFHTHALPPALAPGGTALTGGGTLVAPLVSHGALRGAALVLEGDVDEDVLSVVGALASESALAIQTATLTADLRRSETRFRSLVQNSSDLIAIIDEQARIRYVSPAAERVLGYEPDHLRGADLVTLVHPDDLHVWRRFLTARRRPGTRWSTTCRVRHRSGSWRHTEVVAVDARTEPGVDGIVLNMRDVTERTVLEADLRRQATHDPLTGLPNRALFMERVREALTAPARRRMAVLFIDLDNFKVVNDRFGHAAGDRFLCAVATRLGEAAGDHVLARLGGDEFAILAEVPGGRPQAETLGREVLDALDLPLHSDQEELRARASIGVAIGDSGVDDASDLLRRADLAMYVAKGEGKSRYEVFDARTYETLGVQRRLQAELGAALAGGELEIRYQPIIDLDTLEIRSAEGLVRWHHPTYGLLGPSTFVHLAEEEGLLADLFRFVLREACLQARSWDRNLRTGRRVAVSVNLAPQQLEDEGLVELVQHEIEGTGLAPDLLTLELTENVLVNDPQRAARVMERLKRLGVALAVDDFGTGFSSLAYLRRLPVDILKIDRTFVDGLTRRDGSATLVRTILNLGRELGLHTVAEGVERSEQQDALRRLGCVYGQGFLFASAVPAADFRRLLTEGVVPAGAPTPPAP